MLKELKELRAGRSRDRLPDQMWHAILRRVRGEFEEMPCLRVSTAQATSLFGLPDRVCQWVLSRLESEGFLGRTSSGAYMRQKTSL